MERARDGQDISTVIEGGEAEPMCGPPVKGSVSFAYRSRQACSRGAMRVLRLQETQSIMQLTQLHIAVLQRTKITPFRHPLLKPYMAGFVPAFFFVRARSLRDALALRRPAHLLSSPAKAICRASDSEDGPAPLPFTGSGQMVYASHLNFLNQRVRRTSWRKRPLSNSSSRSATRPRRSRGRRVAKR